MLHDMRIWPQYFNDVVAQRKRFELRRDDRGFDVGDQILLREFVPCAVRCSEGILGQDNSRYTGREWLGRITYILRGSEILGLAEGYCILGIEPAQ